MGKTTSAERMRKLREKLNQDKNKCESFKEKERARDKKRREKMKLVKNLSAKSLMEYRWKETERKRKYRQKIKEQESRPIGDTTIPEIGSFKCPQSLGKAVTKVKRVLPFSPRKRTAVLRKLVYESSPQAAKTLFDKSPKQNTKSSISQDNISKVHEFYNSDDISRQAPGIRDVKSIKDPTSGKRITVQKRHMNMTVFTEVFKLKVSDVYTDSDSDTEKQDGVASCTNETDVPVVGVKPFVDGVTIGTYVLVEFETTTKRQSTRPTKYRYAAICQSNVEDDGEVKVMCMRAVNNSGKLFQVDEKDIYVQFEHILSILPQPNVKQVRSNIFYEFTENVDVFESG